MRADGAVRPVLVCLAGLSPAVVTEAAYGLAVRSRPRVIPDEIYIVTTSDAVPLVVRTLLGPDGAIRRLVDEYRLPPSSLRCDPDRIVVLRNERGEPLADIRTTAESRAAGEQIAALLRRLRQDPAVELHCSVAGGRKTMGALLACALQLVERRGDRLYHVLVDHRFEGQPWFFFPSRHSRRRRIGGRMLDTRTAKVDLAEIPIVRLGGVAEALDVRGDLARRARQLEAVMDEEFAPPVLELRLDEAVLAAGGDVLRLPPEEFALYALYASLRAGCRSCRESGRRGCGHCHPTDDEIFDARRSTLAAFWEHARARSAPVFQRLLRADAADRKALEDFREWIRQARSRIARRLADVDAAFAWAKVYGVASAGRRRGLHLAPDRIMLRRSGRSGLRARGSGQSEAGARGQEGTRPEARTGDREAD